jgi:antitoxin MazE
MRSCLDRDNGILYKSNTVILGSLLRIIIFPRVLKNAQMQGFRNPESGVATNKERLLPRRQVGEPAGGVLVGTLQGRRMRGTPQMGVFQQPKEHAVMGTTVKVREKYQVTIPEEVRGKVPLKVGERVEVTARAGEIVIRPVIEIPRDQAWFWSKDWQDQIAQSRKDLEKGKRKTFKSVKEARKHFGD